MKVHVLSLGCARALVDSEGVAGLLEAAGHTVTDRVQEAECVVVNTCSFIQAAEEESISTILDVAQLKRRGRLKRLFVTGCLPQKRRAERQDLLELLPEVDGFLGTGDLPRLPGLIREQEKERRADARHFSGLAAGAARNVKEAAVRGELVEPRTGPSAGSGRTSAESRFFVASPVSTLLFDSTTPRHRLTPAHLAYLKISEGCDHACTFCSIPQFRGPHRSRTLEDLASEAERLAQEGVVELNLIGQDSSYYGMDRYGRLRLPDLLERLSRIEGIRWIRILYAHPTHVTPELIAAIRDVPGVVRYLDIPLQHVSDRLLAAMRRETDGAWIRRMVQTLRREVPGIALRTTFIVGFPGETEAEVEELARFMREARFERVGIFPYCAEPKTLAERMPDQIPDPIKQERLDRLMRLQRGISEELNRQWLGREIEVLVEELAEFPPPFSLPPSPCIYLGRTAADAPEVDGQVFVRSAAPLVPGQFVQALVTDTYEYDMVAEAVS